MWLPQRQIIFNNENISQNIHFQPNLLQDTLYEDCENDAGGYNRKYSLKRKRKIPLLLTFFSYVVNTEHFIQ